MSAGTTYVDGSRWLLVSIRDVTVRKRRKQQIDFLHRLFRHNVRNRMNVVVGHANILRERGSDDIAEMASAIKRVGDRFVETSEKIRKITRILKDGVKLEVEQTDLSAVVAAGVEKHASAAPSATFEHSIQEDVTIRGDESIRVAVDNLLENAVEHAGEAPTIRVVVREAPDSAGLAEVVVEDDGPGIPDNERVVARDPDAQSQLEHGSGLGLHLVTQAVAVYGGDFDIASRSDGADGTRATITLPLAAETARQPLETNPGA